MVYQIAYSSMVYILILFAHPVRANYFTAPRLVPYIATFDDYLEKPVSLDLLQTSAFKAFKQVKEVEYS